MGGLSMVILISIACLLIWGSCPTTYIMMLVLTAIYILIRFLLMLRRR